MGDEQVSHAKSEIAPIKILAKDFDRFSFDSIVKASDIDQMKIIEDLKQLKDKGLLTFKWVFHCINCGTELVHYRSEMKGRKVKCNHCEVINTIDAKLGNYQLMIFLTERGKRFFRTKRE